MLDLDLGALDLGTLDLLATGACRSSESDSDEELSELVAGQTTPHTCVPIRHGCVHGGKQEAHVVITCGRCYQIVSFPCICVCGWVSVSVPVSVHVCRCGWVGVVGASSTTLHEKNGKVLLAETCATVCDSMRQRVAACDGMLKAGGVYATTHDATKTEYGHRQYEKRH